MTNDQAITQLRSLIGQKQNDIDALNVALTLLETGYQSDKDAVAKGIADGVSATLAPIQSALSGLTVTVANATPTQDTSISVQ